MPNVLITGAGQGIGRATALLLAERGWKVGAYDLQDFPHPDLHTGIMDVTKPTAWETALADFRTNVGEIDVLVNNAGILYGGSFMEAGSFEKDSALVDVNIKGVLYGCRAVRPHLKPGAKVVNLCSASAIYGTPDMAVYSSTKFAVRGITEALNLEWEEDGITVEALWPLYAKTGMLDNVRTTGTDRMGVRLTADHVAKEVADVVERKRGRLAQVHTPVGTQSKVMFALSHFSPAWLTRFANAKLTTNRKIRP
ncbi:SDR family oxidoreductase [Corynebacterium suicordis]|uniref:SDR family oxidoreductase n=1 Tax=Corynebacterium suicordis DSM 45110 TaxID=1121369 RepID=A0ABR9ZKB8_9CORY|nr:SDR family oxidoreductase [Corynebacterium suicordis]MBF4553880.1 SDR family oxidoreductase [Corynebacterium suicordis DSM 45110]MDR6277143.1 NAD(P)-dependent dehydrogenase (short-subunit alcohol dehydrogenase family) [Corynebacterium suicordis]